MRLIELITIYLAAAAPVGVAYFLRRPAPSPRASRLLRAAVAALVWPAALCAHLFARARAARSDERASTRAHQSWPDETRVAAAERALKATLHQTDDLLRDSFAARALRPLQATADSRATLERFVGLTLAFAHGAADDEPSARELELFRVAGRRGDDLLVAGRCVQRRNRARLQAHREQARTDLVHALAELLETVEHDLPARAVAEQAFTKLYWLVIRALAQAFDLLTLLDEQTAALSVARLLDAACAWARRHEVINLPRTAAAQLGDTSCTPHTPHPHATRPTPQPSI
ncbi:MAG TPA: hypothetical protein VF546_00165 [Pyrinomonadaceae bacterium]|jgi:hypothetical protein